MSFSAIHPQKTFGSLLGAGVLALAVACSGQGDRDGQAESRVAASPSLGSAVVAASPASSGSPQPTASGPTASEPAAHGVVAPEAASPPISPVAQKSPIQALNQMVTAQALLVSLLLAPLSKEGAEQPLARVDAASTSGTTR